MSLMYNKSLSTKINDSKKTISSIVKTIVPDKWKRGLREQFLPWRINHIAGPKYITLKENEAAVTCVLKNGEYYIESFVEHYLNMGFRHIIFLDNGSTDKTIELARRHKRVTVYESKMPIESYQSIFKKYIATITVPDGWCLDVDIDEYFDYPYSNILILSKFLEYLNNSNYTAVITQMLDMFSDKPLASLADATPRENLQEVYRYYDISQVKKETYRTSPLTGTFASKNIISNDGIFLLFGGIRKTLFGINCLLSKHSLFRTGKGLELFPHVHFVNNARVADISAVLLHYKLVSSAYDTSRQNRAAFTWTSKGYSDLIRLIDQKPDQQIISATAHKLNCIADLVDNKFISLSREYEQYAKSTGMGHIR